MARHKSALGFPALILMLGLWLYGCLPKPDPVQGNSPHVVSQANYVAIDGNRPIACDAEQDWRGFRSVYPYHLQAIALSQRDMNGDRTLIVSEPPAFVTQQSIIALNPTVFAHATMKQQPVGHGGWVRDFVADIKLADNDLEPLLTRLNDLLFQTNYKAYVIPLPALRPRAERYNLNLRVSAAELRSWVLQSNETLTPVDGGAALDLGSVFKQTRSDVYFMHTQGLVGWWLPGTVAVQTCAVQARKFAIDSDLIVGAFGNGSGVLVVGRERQVPLDVLPPLRFETIALLSAVKKDQLEQSYERTHPLAGRWHDGKDWAPILLSPELRDTEYGSLLNVADQFLKSWSNNGNTHYENFNYSQTASWPFPRPLPDYLQVSRVTYNWNTTGTGYSVQDGNYDVYALNRTGSLPVSYIPGEKESKDGSGGSQDKKTVGAEFTAYNYFSGLNNPYLVRVVQYAALYQIFQHFPQATAPQSIAQTTQPEQEFQQLTRKLLHSFVETSPDQLGKLAGQSVDNSVAELTRDLTPEQRRLYASRLSTLRQDVLDEYKQKIVQAQQDLKQQHGNQIDAIADELAAGRQAETSVDLDPGFRKLLFAVVKMMAVAQNLPESYSKSLENGTQGWIHTPVIVVSWNEGELKGAVGGHNLRAGITRFEVSPDVRPGHPEVSDDGVLKISSEDADRLPKVLTDVARAGQNEEDPAKIPQALRQAAAERLPNVPADPIQSPEVALALRGGGGGKDGGPRGNAFVADDPDFGNVRPVHAQQAAYPVPIGEQKSPGITLVARPEARCQIKGLSTLHDLVGQHYTYEDTADIVARLISSGSLDRPNGLVHIELENFIDLEKDALLDNLQGRYGPDGPEEIRGLLRRKGISVEEAEGVLGDTHDFSRAEIKVDEASIKELPDGRKTATVVVTVPPKQTGIRGLLLRFKLMFRSSVEHPTVKQICASFAESIRSKIHEVTTARDAVRLVHQQFLLLKRAHPSELSQIENSIVLRNGDAYIVDNIANGSTQDINS